MLTIILVVGTVGGVLAIRAKRTAKGCTTAAAANVASCAACTNGALKAKGGSTNFCYVETQNTSRCATDKPACTTVNQYQEN